MKPSLLAQVAVTLLTVVGTSLSAQSQAPTPAPLPAQYRADEMLERWNDIGNKLIAWLRIFPRTSTTTNCRKTSAVLRKIFFTLRESTSI